jgi:RNA polymerase sigma-70 factor, ECF subfamily
VDEELIQAAKAGQPHAGAFLVSLYGPRLLGYCRTIAPDLSDVDRELICEQAIEKACRKLDEYDEAKGSLAAWLRAFVRFGVLSWRRSWGLRDSDHSFELGPHARESDPLPELGPSDPRLVRLAVAVRALPKEHQLLIALRFWESLPTSEIAARLHISDAAVRQRLSRIVRQLRAEVEGHDDGEIGGVA